MIAQKHAKKKWCRNLVPFDYFGICCCCFFPHKTGEEVLQDENPGSNPSKYLWYMFLSYWDSESYINHPILCPCLVSKVYLAMSKTCSNHCCEFIHPPIAFPKVREKSFDTNQGQPKNMCLKW